MIYDVTHVTCYAYEAPVASARCALRLLPRDGAGQEVLSARIDVSPQARISAERADFFGNRRCEAQIDAPHRKLEIMLRARVRVARAPSPAPALTPAWEDAREAAMACASLDSGAPVHFLYPSRLALLCESITAYAREVLRRGRPILEAASELSSVSTPTSPMTPPPPTWPRRSGTPSPPARASARIFSHIMIAGLRGLGLPAVYRQRLSAHHFRRPASPGSRAPMRRTPGFRLDRTEWGWRDLDPTNAIPRATITSSSPAAATMRMWLRSTASFAPPADRIFRCGWMCARVA